MAEIDDRISVTDLESLVWHRDRNGESPTRWVHPGDYRLLFLCSASSERWGLYYDALMPNAGHQRQYAVRTRAQLVDFMREVCGIEVGP